MKEKILSIGAEAVIVLKEENGKKTVVKKRVSKKYRIEELDVKIRKQRNKEEAKILQKLSKLIFVPKILNCQKFEIEMEFVEGISLKRLLERKSEYEEMLKEIGQKIGKMILKIHNLGIIHGDPAPSNFIVFKNKNDEIDIKVIDFGLGYFSNSIEDFAVDLFVMEETFKIFGKNGKKVLESAYNTYFSKFKKGEDVKKRLEKIRRRRRYT